MLPLPPLLARPLGRVRASTHHARCLALLLLCGSPAAAQIVYDDFLDAADLTLTGSATITDGHLQLTQAGADNTAANAFHSSWLDTKYGFTSTFSFTFTGDDPEGQSGGGVALIIQRDPRGASAHGGSGDNLGYYADGSDNAITRSGAVLFSLGNNTVEWHSNSTDAGLSLADATALASTAHTWQLGTTYEATITYELWRYHRFSVALNGQELFHGTVDPTLMFPDGYDNGTSAYFGFGASTGDGSVTTTVDSWTAHAFQPRIWTGAGDGRWSTTSGSSATNWTGLYGSASPPNSPTAVAIFTSPQPTTVVIDQAITADRLFFQAGAGPHTFTVSDGGSLSLVGAGVVRESSASRPGFNVANGTLLITGSQAVVDASHFYLGGPPNTQWANAGTGIVRITDGAKVNVSDTIFLTGASSALEVDGGSLTVEYLDIRTQGELAPRIRLSDPENGYALTLTGESGNRYVWNVIEDADHGPGSIRKTGGDTLTLTKPNTFSGTFRLEAGTLRLQHSEALRHAVLDYVGGAVSLGPGSDFAGLTGTGTLAIGPATLGSIWLVSGDGDHTFNGKITGEGYIVHDRPGTQRFANSLGDFTGAFEIHDGTVVVEGNMSGSYYFLGGTLEVASDASLGAAHPTAKELRFYDHATLRVTDSFETNRSMIFSENGITLDVTDGATLSLQILAAFGGSGDVTKTGEGTLALVRFNSTYAGHTGATILKAGTTRVDWHLGHDVFGTGGVIVDGGTLDFNGHVQTTTLELRRGALINAQAYAGTMTVTGDGMTFSGTIGGTVQVAANGVLDTTNATFTGSTTVQEGGTITGAGTVGALTLLGGSHLSPGNSPGTLFAGDTILDGGGSFTWEINNPNGTAGTHWDLLSISGTLTISATVGNPYTVYLTSLMDFKTPGPLAGFDPNSDYTFSFITAISGIEGFDTDAFDLDPTGFLNPFTGVWSIAQDGNALVLNYAGSAIPEPGTYAALAGAAIFVLALIVKRRRGLTAG